MVIGEILAFSLASMHMFLATSFAIIIYLISPINRELMPINARPHMISFANGRALIPQSEALENVSRVIIHYSNMT